jgi:hypothetical protein
LYAEVSWQKRSSSPKIIFHSPKNF